MFSKLSETFRSFIGSSDNADGKNIRKRKLNEDFNEEGQSPAKRRKPDAFPSTPTEKPLTRRMADWVVNTRKTFAESYYFRKVVNSPKEFYQSVTGKTSQSTESPIASSQFNPLQSHQQQAIPYIQPGVIPYAQQMAYQGQNLERRDATNQGHCTPRSQYAQGYGFSKASLEVSRAEPFSFARTKDSFTFSAAMPPSPAGSANRYPLTGRSMNPATSNKPKTMYEKMYKSPNLQSRVKLRNKLAARESIRISEKNDYARLLQQMTSEPIPGTAFGNSQLRRSSGVTYRTQGQRSSDSWLEPKKTERELSKTIEQIRSNSHYGDSTAGLSTTKIQVEPRKSLHKPTTRSSVIDLTEPSRSSPVVIDLTSDVSVSRAPADLSQKAYLDVQALRRRRQQLSQNIEPPESLFSQSTPMPSRLRDLSPSAKSTPAPPDFNGTFSATERDTSIINIPSSPAEELLRKSLSESKYAQDDWISDLKSKYSTERRRKERQIKEEEVKCSFHREKRDAFEEQVEENLRRKLTLIEREPPVLEEVSISEDTEDTESTEFIALTEEQEDLVDNALRAGPAGQILSDGFKLQITRGDMATLSGLNWLNDEIINFYMNMLMDRGTRDDLPSVHAFNTFFYQKLTSSGHAGVRRWTRRVDVFAVDYILVPVHLGMHWCLSVIDFRKKEIRYYDSMGGNNNQCLNALKQYLEDESMDKKKQAYDTSSWKLINMKDIPQQMNGSDCGMFACKFAEYISRDAEITFSQENMPYFRRRMVLEILQKQFLGEKQS